MNEDRQFSARDREHFDRIADQYERKDRVPGSARARRQRLRQTLRRVPLGEPPDLLEVGCGAGYASAYLCGKYNSYTGIDHSEGLIRIARKRHVRKNVRFIHSDLMQFNSPETFDLALMIGVLHHLEDIPAAVEKVRSLLKPGGYLVVNEPQPDNPLVSFLRFIRKRVDHSYSGDQRELRKQEIETFFLNAGFTEVRSFPQGFLSTPFAEVPLEPGFLFHPIIIAACHTDRALEMLPRALMAPLAWNSIVVGKK